MEFRIADTFTASLDRLTADEQKAAKVTVFDLQANPANPGIQLHSVDRSKDKNFLSARIGRDLRLIVHRTDAGMLLCYADHHDAAYRWAERRVIERHPRTGAAQIVEVRETVREIEVPVYVTAEGPGEPASKVRLFDHVSDDDLLGYGVPEEWLGDARAATEDTLFALSEHLPGEAAEALLQLATGGTPPPPVQVPEDSDPFEHPDAQRRFRLMEDADELERALDYPWEQWTVFLHPAQRATVEREYNGPARVTRVCRHRQDRRRTSPRGPPRAEASGCPLAAHDVQRRARRGATREARTAARRRRRSRAHHRERHRPRRHRALRGRLRPS